MKHENLEHEYQYFLDNKDALCREYSGKFIVIKGEEILGSYDDKVAAYLETAKEHEAGTFLIQECGPDENVPVQMYHSRAVF